MGGVRNHSAGIWYHKPCDRDQWYCNGIREPVFRYNNKDHKFLESALIGRTCQHLRCFDTVVRRPYRYFLIALNVILSLSDRYKMVDTLLCISFSLYQVYAANTTQFEFRDPKIFFKRSGIKICNHFEVRDQNLSPKCGISRGKIYLVTTQLFS